MLIRATYTVLVFCINKNIIPQCPSLLIKIPVNPPLSKTSIG
nr:MAG TPA: hypothetical protein [Caudoviricetes sp.]